MPRPEPTPKNTAEWILVIYDRIDDLYELTKRGQEATSLLAQQVRDLEKRTDLRIGHLERQMIYNRGRWAGIMTALGALAGLVSGVVGPIVLKALHVTP